MSILLSENFKPTIEAFKQDLLKEVSCCLKSTSSVTTSESFSGFNSDLDPSSLATEEISSASFIFEIKDPTPIYCFEIVFDVITERPDALMQSKLNNADIVLRMDVKQANEESYILVNSIEVGLLSDLDKTHQWVKQGLSQVYLFLSFQEKLRKNQQATQCVKTIKDKFFYVKDIIVKKNSTFLLNRGCICVTIELDSEKLSLGKDVIMILNCNLGLVSSTAKHIKDLTQDSIPQWYFSSSLRRKKAVPGAKLKFPLLRVEQLSRKNLTQQPQAQEYLELVDNAVSYVYHHFNAP